MCLLSEVQTSNRAVKQHQRSVRPCALLPDLESAETEGTEGKGHGNEPSVVLSRTLASLAGRGSLAEGFRNPGGFRPQGDGTLVFENGRKGEGQQQNGQWGGWCIGFPAGTWLRVSAWLQFVGSVPPPSGNFGLKLHGAVHEVSSKCRANEWCAGKQSSWPLCTSSCDEPGRPES